MGAAEAWATETTLDPFAAARAAFEQVLRVAGSEETQGMQHSDLERLLAEQGQELMRQLYQDCVEQQAQAEVGAEVIDAQGTERTRTRQQRRELETIFGTVQVQRTGYGAEGQASLHPLDAQLNLPAERYSLEVRRWRRRRTRSTRRRRRCVSTPVRRSASGRWKNWSSGRRRTSRPSTSSASSRPPQSSQPKTRQTPRSRRRPALRYRPARCW